MNAMKTNIELLNDLPSIIAEIAISNVIKDGTFIDSISKDVRQALFNSFVWSETKEGGAFWATIYQSLEHPELN